MAENVRKQSVVVQSSLRKKVICILLVLGLFCIAGICFYMAERGIYVPPEFEKNATEGVPKPDKHFMYATLETEYGYRFSMATNIYQQEDRSAYVYLTNYEENDVKMMCEIRKEETGETYYKSGVILPGQYIEKLLPVTEFPNEAFDATIIIYSFEEGNWYSAGTVEIAAIVQAW